MFDLEQAIAKWREQMLRAGIQSPVPLEELESHLREEIEQQIKSGLNAPAAFALAVEKVGKPQTLKSEFRLAGGILTWLGPDNNSRAVRILSLFWLVTSCWGMINFAWSTYSIYSLGLFHPITAGWPFGVPFVLLEYFYLRVALASFRLFRGDLRDKRMLWFVAIIFSLVEIISIFHLANGINYSPSIIGTLGNFASLWFLRPIWNTRFASK